MFKKNCILLINFLYIYLFKNVLKKLSILFLCGKLEKKEEKENLWMHALNKTNK